MTDPVQLKSLRLTIAPGPLALAPEHAAAAGAHWDERLAANPRLFNGSAFLFEPPAIDHDAGHLAASGIATDYATFLYWRHFRDHLPHHHLFPVGAIVTRDARLVVGRMSAHTANAGRIYPPAGSFDASDVITAADGSACLDPMGNIAREMGEEIGLSFDRLAPEPGWLMLPSTPRAHALVKILRIDATANDLAPELERHIANEPDEELAEIRFIDFATRFPDGAASPYVNDLLAYLAVLG